jgi:hypothetical protein
MFVSLPPACHHEENFGIVKGFEENLGALATGGEKEIRTLGTG